MKTIGILGGMSWESTSLYYKIINEDTKKALGGLNSAKILLSSVNFAEIAALQHADNWPMLGEVLSSEAQRLEQAGANFLVIATNTMHKLVPEIQAKCQLPILHIADKTAELIVESGYKKVAFLGTRFSMESEFYVKRLSANYGLEVLIPNEQDREIIHNVIYKELCQGKISASSKKHYLQIIEKLRSEGAECVIAGCTEITLLIKQQDLAIPLFDTTQIHASAAAVNALVDELNNTP
ncbi:aspartate/glutamate racemase family protein [Marinomonas mediterranea]|uniref:Aspartate racemase n=1 Tax=Marinomonas mediterranea (strain ATCC 700492 / JCM 21426 / NBRC 103028 / MMB-1) TaxID=717774 RepID=F2K4X2_MARM1|nr:aspartate/glutamate racemase family protein [Marinomonas mediterranea]ADZ92615.1 aspartate racemase [Marinomonas mediterranea MMB-1]WCN10556.1 amino acid racemase [Marinomonas mediterranea]WCN14605.1 amino acid racemase [Marinomonas mediterranea]WCN18653.1 amino acid racemase [Marinomonas mediterranea MMB-1]